MQESITQKTQRNNWGCLVIFGLIFVFAGLAAVWSFALPGVRDFIRCRNWVATPCVMLRSEVETVRGEDSDTYRIAVKYRYDVAGRQYIGDRYRIVKSSSSGLSSKQRIVNSLPPGARATCYVNPQNPAESVMDRSIGWDALLLLMPLVALLVGAGIMYVGVRLRRKALAPAAKANVPQYGSFATASAASPHAAMPRRDQPLELKAGGNRRKKLIGLAIFAVLWNGFISFFVYLIFFSGDRADTCARLFIIPFCLVGVALIAGVFYSLLALRNPRPTLTLAREMLRPGDTVEIKWAFDGDTSRIQRLRIYLEARESATYRRGTSTSTDHAVFATISIGDFTSTRDILTGRRTLTIPAPTMPSFRSANNAVEWRLIIHGEIPNWPDVKDEFPLVIYPLTPEGVAHATQA